MLNSFIPYDFMEIESIALKIKKNSATSFLSIQSGEGLTSILNSTIQNLLVKGNNIAIIDVNTRKKHLHEWKDKNELVVFKMFENTLMKRHIQMHNGNLSLFYLDTNKILLEEKDNVVINIKNIVRKLEKEYDYVFIKTMPLFENNKNNLRIGDLKILSSNFIFILKSNGISKAKYFTANELLKKEGIKLSGICVNDFLIPNLFNELFRQINKLKFLPSTWIEKAKNKLYEYKYISKL